MLNGPTNALEHFQRIAKLSVRHTASSFAPTAPVAIRKMSSQSNGASTPEYTPRKLKILMLHGYTQSGPLFHAKTRAFEKALHKAFPAAPTTSSTSTATSSKPKPLLPTASSLPSYPGGIELIYPSGPRKLHATDIPGFTPSSTTTTTTDPDPEPDVPDSRGWWQRNDHTGEYEGMEESFHTIASAIRAVGGIDGVIGFSQGGAAAALVAALLDPGRPEAFQALLAEKKKKHQEGMAYPLSFLKLRETQPQLRFAVAYSAFRAQPESYAAFYEPKIGTPILHFVGSLDTVVEESRSLALAEACVQPTVVYHVGGHFVPIGKEMVGALVGFIMQCCEDEEDLEESVEDMEVLF